MRACTQLIKKAFCASSQGSGGCLRLSTATTTSTDAVTSDDSDGIATITLNSPKTRNALSLDVMRDLRSHILARSSTNTRVVLLRATGSVFSSGHNLKELTPDRGRGHWAAVFDECERLMLDIMEGPWPVVAVVEGLAAAAGCQLVAACDIVVATDAASFSTPGKSLPQNK